MTSLVKQLETAVIAAMKLAVGDSAQVLGFRQSVAEGLVKAQNSDGRPEVIVAVNPATSENYSSPIIGFEVAVSVLLEWCDDPTITAFDEVAALVERQLIKWNCRTNIEAMSAALSTANFSCGGFRLGGGNDAVEAEARPFIATNMNFSVKGVFKDDETETTTNPNQEA